jgi:energy-coupling factor transporter ATP-binding protein EcfA2
VKLISVSIEQLRQFRRPIRLAGLEPGINLVAGPNESGKSTIVQAVRAAFLERYGSGSVTHLQPWGDSSAAPTVVLEFEHGGRHWRLSKRFLRNKRCDLSVDGKAFSEGEAEEQLAELLGFQFSGRGASRPEHWGIPGLLWVEQGAGQALEEPVSHASEHLQSALGNLLGGVASTGGDEVIRAVEAARAELLTKTGKKRGEYAELNDRCERFEQEIGTLEERIRGYRTQVDRLGELRRIQREVGDRRPWETARARANDLKEALAGIRQWQQEQEQERQALAQSRQTLAAYRQQRKLAEEQAERLREREAEQLRAREGFEGLQRATPSLQSAENEAKVAYQAAKSTLTRARQWEQRQRLEQQRQQAQVQVHALQRALERAVRLQGELDSAREALRGSAIDAAALGALRKSSAELTEVRIRSEAIATRLNYDLLEGRSITLGELALQGQGERLLLEAATLDIPEIGTVRVVPGGTDIDAQRRRLEQLEESVSRQLRELGVTSLAAAELKADRQLRATAEVERLQALLQASAPAGTEALRAQLGERQTEAEGARRALEGQPGAVAIGLTPQQAELALDAAESRLKSAESALGEHRLALSRAEGQASAALDEWQRLRDELQNPEHVAALQSLAGMIARMEEQCERLERAGEARQAQIDAANPQLLEQDIARYGSSARIALEEHQRRAIELVRLQSTLESQGVEGLEEQRDTLAADLAHAQRRHRELDRRARALDLLLRLLQEKRQHLICRLQAPLQQHLNHYLAILFPGARLEVDERLVPGRFSRDGEQGPLAELSFGAREQMGLVSRLAYADLLREAGRPTLILLDDSLVHSDRQRLEQMKRILFDAAQRHQILLFSCHPEAWQDLGVPTRDLEVLKAEGAG